MSVEEAALHGPSGKRRRTDRHVKAAAVSSSHRQAEVNVHGFKLKLERLWWQLAANWLQCGGPNSDLSVSSVYDAGRVGRPSRELLCHHVWLPRVRVGIPLAPRVWQQIMNP